MDGYRSLRFFAFVVLTGAVSAAYADEKTSDAASPLFSCTISKNEPGILVPLRIGGKEYPFCIDTGASINGVDCTLIGSLGKTLGTITADTAGAPVELLRCEAPRAMLGDLQLNAEPVVCCDFESFRRAIGRDMRGIIGMSFLRSYILKIDFDDGRLELFPVDTQPDTSWGDAVPLSFESGMPHVTACMGEVESPFLIDTGSRTNSVRGYLVDEFVRAGSAFVVGQRRAITGGGQHVLSDYVLHDVKLGDFAHPWILVDSSNRNRFGFDYLSRFTVVFDFLRARMYLKKGSKYDREDFVNMSGLHFGWQGKNWKECVVHTVDEGSGGDVAGFCTGDQILRVNGLEVSADNAFDDQPFCAGDGKEVLVSIIRMGETRELTVILKDPRLHRDALKKR